MSWIPLLLAETDPWANDFFGLDEDGRFIILCLVIGCTTGVIIILSSIVGGVMSSMNRRNAEYDLKRDMLDRGMSAEEIAQVIEATPTHDAVDRWVASWCSGKKKK